MGWVIERLRRVALKSRPPETWVTLAVVAGSVLFAWKALLPALVLADTTPNGGDLGAHVWAPDFLREELLPRWRLAGWTPDWYAGFPAYHFYMVVPSLLIVGLDAIGLPYNIAFKLVTVSGLLGLPVCAWAMGRLARLPFPAPALFGVAALGFVFNRSYTIYGGNALSTLAGEFAFTISLCFALLFLGVVARGLSSARSQATAAALLGLCVTCHLIPAIFALLAATVILVVVHLAGRPARWGAARGAVAAVVVGGLLTSFWTVPFVLRRAYMNDMGWQKLTTYLEALFPGRIGRSLSDLAGGGAAAQVPGDITWVIVLAAFGGVLALALRRRLESALVVVAAALAVAVRLAPQGRLWNARLLPFWYLCLYLLAAVAVAEIVRVAARVAAMDDRVDGGHDGAAQRGSDGLGWGAVAPASADGAEGRRYRRAYEGSFTVLASLVALAALAFPLRMLPGAGTSPDGLRYAWFGFSSLDQSLVRSWARWDFSGYERKPAYPEYKALVDTMAEVGRAEGCGRAMWEYDSSLDRFGTPMSLMLLPYWTDGCIGSMEGLYFEASATVPYHFLNQSELSAAPSRPQRDLAYGPLDVSKGVSHLQLLGARYYLAFSESAVRQADVEPRLRLVATSGVFRIYEVAGSDLVEALDNEPVVLRDAPAGGRAWQDIATDWYLDDARRPYLLAASGPASWDRVDRAEVDGLAGAEHEALPPVTINDIATDEDSISFTVDRPGVPVLVKASYFPNWRASGADGPYRVAPNLMVVVPTSAKVRLEYGRTPIDWLGMGMTGAGLAGLVALVVVGRRRGPGGERGPGDGA